MGNTAFWCTHMLAEACTSEGLPLIGNTWPETCLFGVGITPQVPPQGGPSPAPKAGVRERSAPQLGAFNHYPQPLSVDSPFPNHSVVVVPPPPPLPQNPSVSPSSKPGISNVVPPAQSTGPPSSPQPHSPRSRRVSPPLLSEGCLCLCLRN